MIIEVKGSAQAIVNASAQSIIDNYKTDSYGKNYRAGIHRRKAAVLQT